MPRSERNYPNERLEKALLDVRKGLSVLAASKRHNVPRSTLRYKSKGIHLCSRKGPPPTLSEENEKIIVKWIQYCEDVGMPVTKELLMDSVSKLIDNLGIKQKFTEGKPGRTWYELFLKRHPNIKIHTCNSKPAKSEINNKSVIKKWFQTVTEHFDNKGINLKIISADRIFNCDEISFSLNPEGQKISAKSISTNNKEKTQTVVLMASASGALAPPMIIFPYIRIPDSIAENIPEDWGIGRSDTGWLKASTFYDYIVEVFDPWLNEKNIEKPIILYLNGHKSHLNLQLSEYCGEHGIEIIALSPNTNHIITEPMHSIFNNSLKLHWQNAVDRWKIEQNIEKLPKEKFSPLLADVLNFLEPDYIQHGFKCTGIFPFDSDALNFEELNTTIEEFPIPLQNIISAEYFFKCLNEEIEQETLQNFEQVSIGKSTLLERDKSLYEIWSKFQTLTKSIFPCDRSSDEIENVSDIDLNSSCAYLENFSN